MDTTPKIPTAAARVNLVTDLLVVKSFGFRYRFAAAAVAAAAKSFTNCNTGSSAESQTGFPVIVSAFPNFVIISTFLLPISLVLSD